MTNRPIIKKTNITVTELMAMKVHPLATLFPLLSGNARDRFVADLRKAGKIKVPVIATDCDGERLLVDGRNRQAFAPEADLDPASLVPAEIYFEATDAEVFDLVMMLNACRRHMDESQRGMSAGRLVLASKTKGKANDEKSVNLPKRFTQDEAAEIYHVSPKTVGFALKVLRYGTPEEIAEVEAGSASVSHQASMISEAARLDHKAAQSQEHEAKHQATLAALANAPAEPPAEAADAPDPDAGADIAETPDDPSSAAPAPVAETPTKAEPKKTKSADKKAEAKQTPKQKAEEAHDRPLIDKAQADAAKDAANFAVEWITAHASDAGEFKTVADALRKAIANAPALAVLRHLLLEGGANCGNGAVNKDAEIARLKAQLALWTGEDADAHSHNAE